MAKGKHWGSFAKGFMDALLASMKLSMEMDYYRSREDYLAARTRWYDYQMGHGKGSMPQGAIDAANADRKVWGKGSGDATATDGGGGTTYAGPDDVKDYVTKAAEARGIDPAVALNFVQGESGGNIKADGDDHSSFGLFQLHYGGVSSTPALSHPGLGDAFTAATGKDARDASTWKDQVDFALDRAKVGGWGDWANTQKKYGYDRFSGIDRNALTKVAKTDTPATATVTKKPPVAMSPSGGATVIKDGKEYDTDKDGNILPDTGRDPKTSQADTLPPSNQVASLDDSMGLDEFLKQHPEAAGHITQQNGPNPIAIPQEGSGPLAVPLMPPYPQSTNYPQSQGGIPPRPALGGGPGNVLEPPSGTPAVPIALGGGRGNQLETPTGTPAVPIALGGGPGNVLEPPSGVVRAPPAPIDPYEATRNIIPARPYTPTPTGGAAEVTRPVEGGDERRQPTDANVPAANAQPAAALTPEGNSPSNPAIPTNPRFVQIAQPNIARMGNARGGREGEGNAPSMGAPNLSWGANPPLSQREAGSNNIVLASSQGDRAGQTVAAPMPPPRPSDGGMVGTPDLASLPDNSFDVTAARKGGPIGIPRYATGGRVMGFAAGGATLGTPATMAQLTSPAYVGPTVSGGWVGTPYGQLAPNQQAWADQQSGQIAQIRGTADPSTLNFTMMPDAVWPTQAAPAAPAPANLPGPVTTAVSTPTVTTVNNDAATGGTTTGAPNLSNIVAPTTNPTTTPTPTTVNPTPKIPSTLVPNAPNTGASDVGATDTTKKLSTTAGDYSGYRRGGAIPRRATLGFAAGGGAPTPTQLADPGWQNTPSTYTLPGNAPFTNQQVYNLQQTINSQPYPFLSPLAPSGSKDLTGFYGAYTVPTPALAAPAPADLPGPVITAVSTPTVTTVNNDAATGGTTTGAPDLSNVVAPTTDPTNPAPVVPPTSAPTVTVTPKTPTTLVPNLTKTANTSSPIDPNATTFNPAGKTPNTSASGSPGATDTGSTNYADASKSTSAYSGFQRGGIPRRPTLGRYAGGGGVTGYAAGATVQPEAVQSALNSALYGPNAPYSQQQVNAGSPTMTVGDMINANIAALSPNQQAWYNAQTAALNGYSTASQAVGSSYSPPTGGWGGQGSSVNQGTLALGTNQQNYYQSLFDPNMPAAPAAGTTAAPSSQPAPAPAIPPTVTAISTPTVTTVTNDAATGGTTTGAYNLPNIVAPTMDPTATPTTTTVNAAPKIPTTLVPNTPSTGSPDIGAIDDQTKKPVTGSTSDSTSAYSGFNCGGVTRRVTGYDFGGDVGGGGGGVSPAPAGMLPGMGGGSPIPPIYYNPATYSGAGAPVGKGVTNTSAPTYVAGAIPALPMFQGGSVRRYAGGGGVRGYDDGGDIEPAPVSVDSGIQQARYDQASDQADEAEDQRLVAGQAAKTAADNAPVSDTSPPRSDDWYYTPQQLTGQGSGQQATPQSNQPQPPDPVTPQMKDAYGNPSNGFVSALAAGFHWLGEHLGLVGGAQAAGIASNPQTQTARQQFATNDPNGATYMTHQNMEDARNIQDPHQQFEGRLRDIGAMEGAYRWLVLNGQDAEAGRVMASMMHYAVLTSQNFGEQAAKELYDGNLKEAVEYINKAADAVPGGGAHAILSQDGKSVSFEGKDLDGRTVWQTQGGAAEAILERATSLARGGKIQWDTMEGLVGRYDPTFRDMAKARMANNKAQAGEAQAVAAAQKFAPAPQPAVAPSAPTSPMPSVPTPPPTITADATTTPPSVPPAGSAASASPPPTADGNLAAVGGDTGNALAALPSGPTHGPIGAVPDANAPTPDATAVSSSIDFNKMAAALDQQESVSHEQVALEAQQKFQPQYEAFPPPEKIANKADIVAFNTRRAEVAAHNAQVDKAKSEYLTGRQKDVSDKIAAARARLQAQETETAATTRSDRAETAATTRSDRAETAATTRNDRTIAAAQKAEDDRLALSQQQPMPPEKLTMFSHQAQPDSGMIEGSMPIDYYSVTPHYTTDANGTPIASHDAKQNFAKDFDAPPDLNGKGGGGGVGRIAKLNNALPITQAYNQHVPTAEIADLLAGGALAKYDFTAAPTPVSLKHDAQGNPLPDGFDERYAVRFTRKEDGSGRTLVMTKDDFEAMLNLNKFSKWKATELTKQPPGGSAIPSTPSNWRGPGGANIPRGIEYPSSTMQ